MISILKYGFIILCFFIFLFRNTDRVRTPFVRNLLAAFFFVAVADYFLIFTDYYPLGILCFCLVQICYCRILYYPLISLLENGMLGCVTLFIASLLVNYLFDITAFLAVFYLFCLLTNTILAWKKSSWSFALGLTLLLLCDIHVGLAHLPAYFSLNQDTLFYRWCTAAPVILWFFYLPSQLILALQYSAAKTGLSDSGRNPAIYR